MGARILHVCCLLALCFVTPRLMAQEANADTAKVASSENQTSTGPKYKPCSQNNRETCNADLGHTSPPGDCTKYCAGGPALFTPGQIDVCEGQVAYVNARVNGDALSTHGDAVIYSGLAIDWDDGIRQANCRR